MIKREETLNDIYLFIESDILNYNLLGKLIDRNKQDRKENIENQDIKA